MDFFYILQWWFFIFFIGLVSLPLTSLLFKSFIDKGYLFSKVIGTLVLSYAIFLLGTLHFLPFTRVSLFALFFIIPFIGYVIRILISEKKSFNQFVQNTGTLFKKNWHIFSFEELLFFVTLSFWSYIRAFQPDIHGLEKFMDFGFVNSILRSMYFPPTDMWFTPFPINYYYFGHLTTAVLTKFSDVPSHISYNLMIATLFAYTFSLSFSIGANVFASFIAKFEKPAFFKLTTIIFCGLLAGFLVSSAGNLHTIYTFFKPYQNESPVPFWQLQFSPDPSQNAYWYPNATRFIYNTIHEFPLYSFVVSDLHGHVLSIPIVLTIIAILLYEAVLRKEKIPLKTLLILSFLIAAAYMTNAWDGIIYLTLSIFVFIYLFLKTQNAKSEKNQISIRQMADKYQIYSLSFRNNFTIYYLLFTILILIVGFVLFSLPFSLFFKPFVSGIGVLCAPSFLTKIGKIGPLLFEENHCQKSPLWQLMILYGFFYFWVIVFLTSIIKKFTFQTSNNKSYRFANFANWDFFRNLSSGVLRSKGSGFATTGSRFARKLEIRNFFPADIFIFILILLSTLLIIIPEFIYAKDIYPAHYRANTMFKLGYEAFIMLSLVSAYSITRTIVSFKFSYGRFIVFIIGSITLFIVSIYPYYAITSYYGNLTDYKTLDGTAYLKPLYPTDYDAILWLNKNIKNQPVILEAQGDSYTDFARISANTGLPTVLGWTVHEWLWRGDYSIPSPRIAEVQTVYESSDVKTVKDIIKKYDVSLIFIGDLERQKYPKLNEEKFKKLGKAIYSNLKTTVYRLNATQ